MARAKSVQSVNPEHKALKVPAGGARLSRRAQEREQDRADEAAVQAREESRKANDPISQPLDYGPFAFDQSVTQVFGGKVIELYGGVDKLPRWRFKRWYFRDKVLIDTFYTQSEYDRAEVEQRRKLAKKLGVRYAALGPNHSILPHSNKELREKFPSQVEQLELA